MMKKILLGTTAIVGASVLMTGAALAAEKPQLEMSGYLRFEAWFNDQDENADASRGVAFEMDDVEIHFKGKAVADNGLEYGFKVELQESGSNAQFDEADIYLKGNWGTLSMGADDGAEDSYKVLAADVLAGKNPGWDGGHEHVLNEAGIRSNVNADPASDSSDANKLFYQSPSFNGFDFGVSYTPDTGDTIGGHSGDDGSHDENALAVGIGYDGEFSGVSVKVGAAYYRADIEDDSTEDSENFRIGTNIGFSGFEFGVSYLDNFDTGLSAASKAAGYDAPWMVDVAASYATGPYKVGIGYMHSEADEASGTEEDETDFFSITAHYAAAPGLMFYTNYNYIDLDQAGTASDNDASIFMVGTQVSF